MAKLYVFLRGGSIQADRNGVHQALEGLCRTPAVDEVGQAVGIDPDGDVPDAADFIANPKKVVEAAGRFAVAAKDQFAVLVMIYLEL